MKLDLDAAQILDAAAAANQLVSQFGALGRLAPVLERIQQLVAAVPALESQVGNLQHKREVQNSHLDKLKAEIDAARLELTAMEARLEREAREAGERIANTIEHARQQAKVIIQDAEAAARDIEEKAAARRAELSDELDALAAKRDEAQANLDNMNLKISETLAKLAALAGGKVDEPAS